MSIDSGFEVLELKEIGGLFSLLSYIVGTFLIGVSWKMPLFNWVTYCINYPIQISNLMLDKLIKTEKIEFR